MKTQAQAQETSRKKTEKVQTVMASTPCPSHAVSLSLVEKALVTKELGKAQAALWAAFTVAARANDLDLAKALRDQHRAMGAKIVEINGGPVVSLRELIR